MGIMAPFLGHKRRKDFVLALLGEMTKLHDIFLSRVWTLSLIMKHSNSLFCYRLKVSFTKLIYSLALV